MAPTKLFLLTVALSVFSSSSASLLDDYVHFAALDPAERIKLYWTIHQSNKSVSFALEAATTGWVGFGISSGSGMMKGADIVIGWVKNGKPFLTDRYAEGEYMPEIDEHNDYHLVSGEETNGTTILKFYRKIDTCDPKDRKLKEGTTKVVFALNDEDPEYPTKLKRHTFRGARSILLLNSQGNRNKPDPSWSSFKILKRNYEVPSKHTTYHCSIHQLPDVTHKNHIVRFDPVVELGNEGVVHHFIVMACEKDFPGHLHLNLSSDCDDHANMPRKVMKCRGRGIMVGAWGVGGGAFVFPQHVGLPMGKNYTGRYFLMVTHYDNPDHKIGIRDNSGVQYYYTSKLRRFDAGVLTVGSLVSPWHMIPPQQKDWLTRSFCKKDCTEKYFRNSSLPGKGINIFSSILHAHLSGRAVWTQHVRDGVELPEIARDDTYDFNFQDIRFLRKEVHLKPGDDIINTCVYNTMDRTRLTYGGASTREEMCLNFMFYYPFIPEMPRLCASVDFKAGVSMMEKHYSSSLNKNASLFNNPIKQSHVLWTLKMTEEYKQMIKDDNRVLVPFCDHGNKWRNVTDVHDLVTDEIRDLKVKITTPLPDPKEECNTDAVPSSATRTSVYLLYEILMMALIVIIG